jgi:hypothetical protein
MITRSLYRSAVTQVFRVVRPLEGTLACVHGSAATGELSTIPELSLPISDIDILVVSSTWDGLEQAVRLLTRVDNSIRRPDAPFFRLGVKFRLVSELVPSLMNANEVAALRFGRWGHGRRPGIRGPLSREWFQNQAALSIATRSEYDAPRLEIARRSLHSSVHLNYLAARTALETATVILLAAEQMARTYSARVTESLRLLRRLSRHSQDQAEWSCVLREALRVKRSPGTATWLDYDSALRFLRCQGERVAALLSPTIVSTQLPWSELRPLDGRDKELWKRAGGESLPTH